MRWLILPLILLPAAALIVWLSFLVCGLVAPPIPPDFAPPGRAETVRNNWRALMWTVQDHGEAGELAAAEVTYEAAEAYRGRVRAEGYDVD